ncbi:MAG: sulfatase-like hydrolase/transferase [Actinomycetota bacterium]|nr:sulfatase-like hydrolase/transferase [Actinomycetota bacterium]MDQ3645175.1 sulfatase-like hydrolase/transferase [Actinomycetota bacterium]
MRRLTRRQVLELGGGAAGLAVMGADPTRALGAAPAATNVVVIILDNVRSDFVTSRRIRTPNLDRLAAQSLRFGRYRPEVFPTIPARRSIMTGRRIYPFRGWRPVRGLPGEPGWEPIDRNVPVFTDVLGRAGYRTGYVTDNPHILGPAYDGFMRRFDRPVGVKGQVPFRGKPPGKVSQKELLRHLIPALRKTFIRGRIAEYLAANAGRDGESDFLSARVFTAASEFLEQAAAAGKRFALVVDSFDPHEPWDPPERYLRMYGSGRVDGVKAIQPFSPPGGEARTWGLSGRDLGRVRNLYAAEVTMVDAWLGRFLDRLEALGLAQSTAIVLCSDHGVLLGERGQVGKHSSQMHREVTDVPLMIRHPRGRRAGTTSDYFASTHDIAPTVLALLGKKVPQGMDGVDLSVIFRGRRPPRRGHQTASYGRYVSATDGRWLLIADNQGRDKRLYDTRRDPGERRDVAARHPAVVRRLWGHVIRDAGGRRLPAFSSAASPADVSRAL